MSHLRRAVTLSLLGRHPEALSAFQRAHRLDPTNPLAPQVGGKAMLDTGLYGKALESIDRALSTDSKNATLLLLKVHALLGLGRHGDAILECERAILQNPELAGAYDARGRALLALGKFSAALQSFDNALSLDADLASSQRGKDVALRAMGRHDEVKGLPNRATVPDPKAPPADPPSRERGDGANLTALDPGAFLGLHTRLEHEPPSEPRKILGLPWLQTVGILAGVAVGTIVAAVALATYFR